jgi:hypothetical protein
VGIFAVMRDRVMDILAKWNDLGVTPDYVTIGPVAAYNAVAFDQNFGPQTPGTVILDVGTTATDLVVSEPGRVWVRTFQIGGHQFTEALVNAFKLSYSKADDLKQQSEQHKHARHILQAMRPVFGDLAQEVQRSIGYYQSGHRDANLTRLIALGSTFNLPGLRKFLGQQLQMEIVRLEKFNRLSVDGPRGAEFEAAAGSLATAYGLALQGLGFQHGIMVNLMPVSIVREGMWSRKTKWFAAAAGLSIAAAGAAFYRPLMDKATLPSPAQRRQDFAATANDITRLKNEWKNDVESKFTTDYRAANVAMLLNNRDVHARLADDLGQMLAGAQAKAPAPAPAAKPGDKTPPAPAPQGLQFVGWTTSYAPPGSTTDPNAPPGSPPAAPDPTATAAVGGRVRCELEVTMVRPLDDAGALAFVRDNIVQWIEAHATRDGVPYDYDKATVQPTMDRKEIPKPNADPNASGGQPPAWGQEGGGAAGGDERGGGGGGRGGGMNAPPSEGGGGGMNAPPSDPGGSGGNSPQPQQVNLDQLAPLPPAPPPGEPGQVVYRFKIPYEAVIKAPAKPAEKAEGKS